jgi:hypothetical protein
VLLLSDWWTRYCGPDARRETRPSVGSSRANDAFFRLEIVQGWSGHEKHLNIYHALVHQRMHPALDRWVGSRSRPNQTPCSHQDGRSRRKSPVVLIYLGDMLGGCSVIPVFPGPPSTCSVGIRSSIGGSGGNGSCGSAWYQYATE